MIVKHNKDEFSAYLRDASNTRGDAETLCIPESIQDIQEMLARANRDKTPITVSGNGTGLNGGRCPAGGYILSLEKLNRITEIETAARTANVEPGVLLRDLQAAANAKGLFYPPDPTEELCFIGATIATNASGAKSFSYGPTRNFVEELDIVFADSTLLRIQRGEYKAVSRRLEFPIAGKKRIINIPSYKMPNVKNSAGYFVHDSVDLIDIFIGSEGTLGVIAGAKVRLLPLPENVLSCVAVFREEGQGLRFIREVKTQMPAGKYNPRALEFFNGDSLNFLRQDYPFLPAGTGAAVWFEEECNDAFEETAEKWLRLIEGFGGNPGESWTAADKSELDKIRRFRHAISAKVNEYVAARGLRKLGTDTAVPDIFFEEFYNRSLLLAKASGLRSVSYGHFGDGHLHLNLLPADGDEFMLAKETYNRICKMALEYGGTISAEHGIGKTKHELLRLMYGEKAVREMALLKHFFDPRHILNRDNIFPSGILDDLFV